MAMLKKENEPYSLGAPFKYTPEGLDKKFEEFVEYCRDKKVPMTIGRLCVILDAEKEYLTELGKHKQYGKQIKRYRLIILADKEERLNAGRGSVAGTIFDLKNNHGWTDKQEVEHKGEMPVSVLFKEGPEANREIDITPEPKQLREAEKIIEVEDENKND